ncbi:hypothetical protein FB45DRAFT_927591 [Roridomyces roridus]|uniref:Uncharacterized protein n=1 Tax=Roridomyces roridus TaxID=1738132 RepID=A0AAD7BJ97_9AGAR|nr:hypothetical protein FB45DRAFT_927591 [Roridomyces roridus]
MDSQWCLDACPTCARVVDVSSIYCAKCEPDVKQLLQSDLASGPYTSPDTRVTAWALDCYQSTRNAGRPTSVPPPIVFPSPSGRKLHLRKTSPTVSWISPEPELAHSPSTLSSPPLSTPTAVQSLSMMSNSVGVGSPSPASRPPARSWVPAAPGPSARRASAAASTKPNTYHPPPSFGLQRRPESCDRAGLPSSGQRPAGVRQRRSTSMLIPGTLTQQQHPASRAQPSVQPFRKNALS